MSKRKLSPRGRMWLCLAALTALRLVLAGQQLAYVWVGGAPLDDELMFRAANSISAGQWLGGYDYLTLSKAMFFPVWLALLHALHLPYLVGGAALWCAASLLAAFALRPLWAGKTAPSAARRTVAVYAALAFLPSSWAAYTLRVYRDNIFPALCLVFFAGWAGAALRAVLDDTAKLLPWLAAAGAGLACAYLTREDAGLFLLPFAAAATLILLVIFCVQKKPRRIAGLLLPYAMLAAGVLGFCGLNQRYYGVFALSDFSQGSFAAAMGAMMRVDTENEEPLLSVPQDARQKIVDAVPELQPVLAHLENDDELRNSFYDPSVGDYRAGSYYWAIRRAAWLEGVYDTPQHAAEFWQSAADAINAACDAGVLPSRTGKRVATNQPIRAALVPDTLRETAAGFAHALFFADCPPQESLLSLANPDDTAVYTAYLHCGLNGSAQAGTDKPYYNPVQQAAYAVMNAICAVYRWFLWLLLAAAVVRHLAGVRKVCTAPAPQTAVPWLLLFGLLGMAVLRCAMIAFVEVSSFGIGTSTMYLATVHPLLVLFTAAALADAEIPFKKHKEKS